MWNPFAKSYTFDLSYKGKKVGKIENLAGSITVPELKELVRVKCALGNDMNVKLMLPGGKQLGDEGELGSLKGVKSGVNKVLVISSAKKPVQEPPKSKPKMDGGEQFRQIEDQLDEAERRFQEYLAARATMTPDERSKALLWFNSVVNAMTRIDGLKMTARELYDADQRGRGLIRRCSVLLDQVDAEKQRNTAESE